MRPASSPGCGSPGCWCGCGSARPIRDRSPGMPSRSPAIPGRTGHRPGTAAGGSPPGSPCPGCGTAGAGDGAVRAEHPGAFRFTAPERDAIYAHASRQAAAAAEHIRRCAHGDPAAAADAAWAAADTLHVAARALRSRELRCAADAYDRAARAPHGRLPRRSRDGDQLRRTARLIALAGQRHRGQHAHGDRARREPGRPRRCRGRAAAGPAARRAIGSGGPAPPGTCTLR